MGFNIKALAITLFFLGGGGLFGLTVWMMLLNGMTGEKTFLGLFLPFYSLSITGCIAGGIYGALGGLIGAVVFGVFYNIVNRFLPANS